MLLVVMASLGFELNVTIILSCYYYFNLKKLALLFAGTVIAGFLIIYKKVIILSAHFEGYMFTVFSFYYVN